MQTIRRRRRRPSSVALACSEALESRDLFASISAVTPFNGQPSVAVGANVVVTFGSAMNAATLTASQVTLRDASGALVPAALSYNTAARQLTLDPTANLATTNTLFTLRVAGGSAGVKASDGTTLATDFAMGFSTGKPTFTQQTVLSNMIAPTNVEFAADGRVFVAEKSGLIKMFSSLSSTATPTIVADLRTNVHNFWDRGLLGMALDPKFTTGRPYIYVLYTADADVNGTAPKWGQPNTDEDDGGPSPTGTGVTASGRLSRLTISANGLMTGSEQVLIADWSQQFPSHSVGDLKFGPDGYLYASAGDGANFNAVDNGQFGNPFNDPANEGGALRSQDILSDGDAAGLDGTIIRINPDTGAAAPGNPFSTSADANKQKVIANGLRNPYRITFKPGTNELWIAETGWNTYEEIDRLPDVTATKPTNFGWPAYEGNYAQPGYAALNSPLLAPLLANPALVTMPFFSYSHTEQVVPGNDDPSGGSSPTGIAFNSGNAYPTAYNGAMFFADYSRSRIFVMTTNPDGSVNAASRQVVGVANMVELTSGPDGYIYGVDLIAGSIVRLVADGANRAPIAKIVADKSGGTTPLVVHFDGTFSNDPEGGALTYAWDLDGDGNYNDSTSATPSWTYTTSADVTVKLRVTDPSGLSTTQTFVVNVANSPPVPTIASPTVATHWKVGDVVSFSGSAYDAEDGTLAATKLSWDLILIHASDIDPNSTHQHHITGVAGVSSGTFVTPDHEYPSWLILTLTATDSRGLSATTSVRLDPKTVVLTFGSNVAGTTLVVNDESHATPFSTTVIQGSTNTVSAPGTETLGNSDYTFAGWSQGGAASQTMTAPLVDASYALTYTTTNIGKLAGTVIGTLGSRNNATNTRDKAFDGDFTTYFDAPTAAAWAGLDLGTARPISFIRFVPRAGYASAMVGGTFQASTTADFSSGNVTLYTISTTPADGVSTISVSAAGSYRYVRYLAPTTAYGNVAEVEFDGPSVVSPVAAPNAPTSPIATVVSGTQVNLSWTDASSNETGFVIQRRYTNWIWGDVATVNANATSYVDASVYAGVSYEYRVATTNASGTSAWADGVVVDTGVISGAPPAAPSALVATPLTATRVDLAWTDNSANESGFRVERRVAGTATFGTIATVSANVRAYSDTSAVANTSYEYRVFAITSATSSAASNVATAKTPTATGTAPVAPSGLAVLQTAAGTVKVSWLDNSSNETGFVIQRRYSGWIWGDIATVGANATSYLDTAGVYASCEYEYRVVAINAVGTSNASNSTLITIA